MSQTLYSEVPGPHPDGHGYPETTLNNYFHHFQQLLFQQHIQKVIPWDSPWSGPRPCSLRYLDITQMVMDIQKELKTMIFIIPNKFCFNNIAKKSFLGTPLGQVPDHAVRGAGTSPRWSWTFPNDLKQLLSSFPTTFVSTTLPKSHSLGLPLVRFQPLQSEAAGPFPNGHGLFAAIQGWSVGQELSFDTLTLSPVPKLTEFHLFFFLLLTQIII